MPNEPGVDRSQILAAVTLCDDGEEPIEVMIPFHVGDGVAIVMARNVMQDEDHDDIEDMLNGSAIVRRHSRWVPAPEGSPHDEILETCKPDAEGAFAATHVIFP